MAETNLAFSKVVATPTPTAWSQAYSAGRLFAVISLHTDAIPEEGHEHLTSVGKDMISTLESEFFTLETKNLDSIRQALATTLGRVESNIKISTVVCFLSDNVLYLFATGGGKAILKRGEKIGTVLQAEDSSEIKSASGYVQEGDIIILQTKPFLRIIQPSTLASSLDNNSPAEIAENLAPHVHDKSEGGASAIILLYKNLKSLDERSDAIVPPKDESDPESENQEPSDDALIGADGEIPVVDIDESPMPQGEITSEPNAPIAPVQNIQFSETSTPPTPLPTPTASENIPIPDKKDEAVLPTESGIPYMSDQIPKKKKLSFPFKLPSFIKFPKGLTGRKKITLAVAVILTFLIIITSILAISNRKGSSNEALFADIYAQAQEKYEEGINLKDLNAPLAQESLNEAKVILEKNQAEFDADSEEGKQISNLLTKVKSELETSTVGETVEAKEVNSTESDLLSAKINNSGASYFVQNEDFVYFLDGKGVSRIDKGNDEKEEIIEKSWKDEGGIGLFGSNVYVLDKAKGILKFTPSGANFTEGNYFPGDVPDLTEAVALAIDGSLYVLSTDGNINKYTKGTKDEFSISGLDKPLSSPTKIFTNEDTEDLYILDNGNNRVVVLSKTGAFQSAYSASIIKSATEFDVSETDKRILILSGDKVYQVDIK